MGTLQTQASLKKLKNLVKVAATFIQLDDGRKLLRMDDDVETTNLRLWTTVRLQRSGLKTTLLPNGTPSSPDTQHVLASIPCTYREPRRTIRERRYTHWVLPALRALSTAPWFSPR